MNEETAQRLQDLFVKFPVLVATGVGEEEIDAAEKAIGVPFVPDYRWFLRRYGGAMVKSLPVFGLRSAPAMWNSTVVDETMGFRKRGWKRTDQLVVISVDGSGNPIGIGDGGRVWISDLDVGADTVIASSFENFIAGILDDRIM